MHKNVIPCKLTDCRGRAFTDQHNFLSDRIFRNRRIWRVVEKYVGTFVSGFLAFRDAVLYSLPEQQTQHQVNILICTELETHGGYCRLFAFKTLLNDPKLEMSL